MHIINLGQGLGSLKFGSSREQTIEQLGKPSEKDMFSLSDGEEDDSEAWHYDTLDVSLSFDQENDWKLTSIAISSPDYTLNGISLIGKTKDEVLKALENSDLGEVEEDEEIAADNPDSCLLYLDEVTLSLWFDEDVLTELQWGPFHNNHEIVWP